MTLYWAVHKTDYFIFGCDKLFVGTDHKPLLTFFGKEDPKPLDHINNKRLRKYVAELGEVRFTMFHIEGAKNHLADRGSRLPSGKPGNDEGDGAAGEGDSARVQGAAGAEFKAHTGTEKGAGTDAGTGTGAGAGTGGQWPHSVPQDDISCYPTYVQIFAYGAYSPAEDAEVLGEEPSDSDDYVGQCMVETASYLSISAGRRVSVAMTVDKLKREIELDISYKYICQVINGSVKIAKFVDNLAVLNYHRDNLTVSPEGLVMFKGSRFLVPQTLRPGLLKALHSGHASVGSMMERAKEVFWWPGITPDIEQVRANCRTCHKNAPSQAKLPSQGVFKTQYAYEALCLDHFFLKGVEYLSIADHHPGMLSVHATVFRGAKELLKILRVHCQRQGIPRCIFTDGSSIFCAQEVKDFFKRYDIQHFVSSVGHPHANLRNDVGVKILKRMLRDVVSESGSLDHDSVTEALLNYANTRCRVLKKSPAEIALVRCMKDFYPRLPSMLVPRPGNLLSGLEKDRLQGKIRQEAGDSWSEHCRPLKPLQIGDFVMLQNLKGSHPLKSDYSGEVVGLHNVHSYAVKVQPGGRVTARNRATLRKIPKPAPVHIPVIESELARPPREPRAADPALTRVTRSLRQGGMMSGNGHVDTVLTPADGRVNRSRESGDLGSRQETLDTVGSQGPRSAGPAVTPGQSNGSVQGLMKQAPGQSDQEFGEAIFENLLEQVRPGLLRKSHVSGQRSLNDDSGPSREQARGVQPVQAASPGGQPAGVGPTRDKSVRLASRESTDGNKLAVQDLGVDQLAGTPQSLAGAVPGGGKEVSPIDIRRSGRQRIKLSPYQAGTGGME